MNFDDRLIIAQEIGKIRGLANSILLWVGDARKLEELKEKMVQSCVKISDTVQNPSQLNKTDSQ